MLKQQWWLAVILSGVLSLSVFAEAPVWQVQDYAPASVDNPLKGLVPYADSSGANLFPHSMEFSYFPLSAVVTGPDSYDWTPLESFLAKRAERGMQAIFRFYLEYPGKPSGVPRFLLENGLKVVRYQRPSTPPRLPVDILAPDYNEPALREVFLSVDRDNCGVCSSARA